ncbi:hypothetical protein OG205_30930 [Lentzea sp. NBC_00516]|uniref:hypothetical protein n=1 Tax=Lentzea sp. NBC_00516 TaxID=2903582 RepID=UPI002E8147DC|nr:hypothetical protein [Lentzea sp. NBC_00516]WUD22485.1 hypothetical protein OG205_30930 [Lentzea sp. NBC_00516]
MGRRGARSLLIGTDRFIWSVRHSHENGWREVVRLRREGAPGQLVVVFRAGDGHLVADGFMHAGQVRHADGRSLNLNRPGVIRALLDEASARGWQAEASELDGWELFDAVARRSEPPQRG